MAAKKVIRRQHIKVKKRVIYIAIGVFIWIFISFGLFGIAIEQFQNKENYLKLALWIFGIGLGYAGLIYLLLRTMRKKEPA